MAAAPGLQPAGQERPGGAEQRRAERSPSGTSEQAGQGAEVEADERRAEAADSRLPLAADVEQPGMEGDRDREAGEDEVGGVEEREAERLAGAEAPAIRSRVAVSGFSPMPSTTSPATRNAAATAAAGTRARSARRGSSVAVT